MKQKLILLLVPFLLVGCGGKDEPKDPIVTPEKAADYTHQMTGDSFTIVNLSDIQFAKAADLNDNTIIAKSIKKSIEEGKPDIITFSGDQIDGSSSKECYEAFCTYMDAYKIPYYIIMGNHDRLNITAQEIKLIMDKSTYGHFTLGPTDIKGDGNYTIDIKNSKGSLVHSVLMMDSGGTRSYQESDYKYVDDPVDDVYYKKHNQVEIYGTTLYDNVRGNQLTWYEEQINRAKKVESTVITHMAMREYHFAIEDYYTAVQDKKQAKIDEMKPIGPCHMFEAVGSSPDDTGFFTKMKTLDSTKNVIVCHDHVNDYSLLYQGIRLTYGVKTGDGNYWRSYINGYTKLVISDKGQATLTQNFIEIE